LKKFLKKAESMKKALFFRCFNNKGREKAEKAGRKGIDKRAR
jgi:hypothetical protein